MVLVAVNCYNTDLTVNENHPIKKYMYMLYKGIEGVELVTCIIVGPV